MTLSHQNQLCTPRSETENDKRDKTRDEESQETTTQPKPYGAVQGPRVTEEMTIRKTNVRYRDVIFSHPPPSTSGIGESARTPLVSDCDARELAGSSGGDGIADQRGCHSLEPQRMKRWVYRWMPKKRPCIWSAFVPSIEIADPRQGERGVCPKSCIEIVE
jgi:hypothetical protein